MLRVTLISALAITLTVATPIATTTGDSPPGNFTIQDAHCNAFSSGGNIGNCQWCANYLTNLGSTACGVDRNNGYPPEFCGHGNVLEKCQVYGTLPAGIDSTSSSCSDVALSVTYLINNCDSNGGINGWAVANGNGNLHVEVHGLG